MTANSTIIETFARSMSTDIQSLQSQVEQLTAERDHLKQREALYLGPDCHGFLRKDVGYVPACVTQREEITALTAERDALDQARKDAIVNGYHNEVAADAMEERAEKAEQERDALLRERKQLDPEVTEAIVTAAIAAQEKAEQDRDALLLALRRIVDDPSDSWSVADEALQQRLGNEIGAPPERAEAPRTAHDRVIKALVERLSPCEMLQSTQYDWTEAEKEAFTKALGDAFGWKTQSSPPLVSELETRAASAPSDGHGKDNPNAVDV